MANIRPCRGIKETDGFSYDTSFNRNKSQNGLAPGSIPGQGVNFYISSRKFYHDDQNQQII